MIYLKHYWMRDSQYLTEPGQNGSLQYHPGAGIDGFSVRYWLTDDRGVDMNFTVYSKEDCPYCHKIKTVLELTNNNFVVYNLNEGLHQRRVLCRVW
jgi:hypothetical protein